MDARLESRVTRVTGLTITPGPSARSGGLRVGSSAPFASGIHSIPPGGVCIRCWSGRGKGAWDIDSTMARFRTWYFVIHSFYESLLSPFYIRPCAEESMMHKHWCIPWAGELTPLERESMCMMYRLVPPFFQPNNLGSFSSYRFQVVRFLYGHPFLLIEEVSESIAASSSPDFIRKKRSPEWH